MKSIQISIVPCELTVPREIVEIYVDSVIYASRMFDSSAPSFATAWIREMVERIEMEIKAYQNFYDNLFEA
jgi:hypothetical protein